MKSTLCAGAGDGNRTHVTSLEGWNSTIELHPRVCFLFVLSFIDLYILSYFDHFVKPFSLKKAKKNA